MCLKLNLVWSTYKQPQPFLMPASSDHRNGCPRSSCTAWFAPVFSHVFAVLQLIAFRGPSVNQIPGCGGGQERLSSAGEISVAINVSIILR